MKNFTLKLMALALLCLPLSIDGQIRVNPAFPTVDDNVTITYDAAAGNGALNGVAPIYIHTGVLTPSSTSSSDWKFVKYNWGVNQPDNTLTQQSGNTHTISYNIRSYHNIPAGQTVNKLAMVFRNADGSKVGKMADGTDIFWDVWDGTSNQSRFVFPLAPSINVTVGESIPVECALSNTGNMQLRIDGVLVASRSNTKTLTYNIASALPGLHTVELRSNVNGNSLPNKTFTYFASPVVTVENPPAGLKIGANDNGDGSVTFVLRAPGKSFAYIPASFNNWQMDNTSLMKRSVDGNTHWLRVTGFTAGQTYMYQYQVENTRIADPMSKLVLDPSNDQFIQSGVYPNLPAYPSASGVTGYVTVYEYQKPGYGMSANFNRPNKSDLVIYELLVRDFTTKHSYQGILDSLFYLKNLGVNAIELMPLHEFEGNESWGYNPVFYSALDKAYGSADKLKEFVDVCHQNGIAVILDVAFNHMYSTSPLCQLYWDAANFQPTSNNPWVNQIAKHPFSPGYDLNHESGWTREYVDAAIRTWLTEFKFDGLRFDLSKGFTQRFSGDISSWNQYDQSRIDILQYYYNTMQSAAPGTYMICEHLGSESEENEMTARGMMVWQKLHENYKQAAMGWSTNSDLGKASPQCGTWPFPKFDRPVAYAVSHDEERLMVECLNSGNGVAGYSTRDYATAVKRQELVSAFLFTIPGAKMLWQFDELGYDYSIDFNGRVSPKPIRWDYYNVAERRRLYRVMGNIINLRTKYPSVFRTNNHGCGDLNAGSQAWWHKHFHLSPDGGPFWVTIIGNFDVVGQTVTPYFQHTGTWYDYLSGQSLNVSSTTAGIYLQPGEYRIYTNQRLAEPPLGYVPFSGTAIPVELTYFTGKLVNKNDALLSWETLTERNNRQFTVERSLDGKLFTPIATVKGKGTTNEKSTYSLLDPALANGTYYYRLVQTDFSGETTIHKTIALTVSNGAKALVYPNPAKDRVFVKSEYTEGDILVLDNLGRVVLRALPTTSELDLSTLAKGVYFVKIGQENFKIVKE